MGFFNAEFGMRNAELSVGRFVMSADATVDQIAEHIIYNTLSAIYYFFLIILYNNYKDLLNNFRATEIYLYHNCLLCEPQ